MKHSILVILTILFWNCKSPETVVQKVSPDNGNIEVLCLAKNCSDKEPLNLYEFNGIGFTKIKELEKVGKDSFALKMPQGQARFLYVGTASQAKLPVIFSDENLLIEGNCKTFRRSKIQNSPQNVLYNDILQEIRNNKRNMQMKLGEYRKAAKSPEAQEEIRAALAAMDQKHMAYLDTIRGKNPFLANIAALGTMMSYPNKKNQYLNEVDFFASEYFKNADLASGDFNNIPYLFEAFKDFSQTIASVGLDKEAVRRLIDQNLNKVPDASKALRYALGGTSLGLQAKNHPLFVDYANIFIEKFGATTDQASIDRLKTQLNQAKSFVTGGQAPEIALKTPEGEELKLSDMKGKVVLIDFWASWCGPCRRENPNVVRVYNKYNRKGFEILGVSLDKTKDKWMAAIEKDGLTWPHVSDLKGWQSKAAQTYGVRSIPHTVLVDRQGKIIARNLRGSALERKLAEIFD